MSGDTRHNTVIYYTVSYSDDEDTRTDGAPRGPFRSRERAIEAARAWLAEHAARFLHWGRGDRGRGFEGEACDERGSYIYPGSGNGLDQRVVDGSVRVESVENDAVIQASAEIEWREVQAYDKRIETVVDGHTYTRTERVCNVVHDWQPLCLRRYGLAGDDVRRARAKTFAYVNERRLEFVDD